jgi:hypothetical protein
VVASYYGGGCEEAVQPKVQFCGELEVLGAFMKPGGAPMRTFRTGSYAAGLRRPRSAHIPETDGCADEAILVTVFRGIFDS